MIVRKADYKDLDRLIELGKMAIEEAVTPLPEIDRTLAKDYITRSHFHPHDCVCFVAEQGEVCGFIVAYIGTAAFSVERNAYEHALYVEPSKRGSKAAVRLIRSYEYWARAVGAKKIQISVDTGRDIKRIGKFYEKMGYAHAGGVYLKWAQ